MILNIYNATDSIQHDMLIGVPLARMAIFASGTEQRSADNINIALCSESTGFVKFISAFTASSTIPIIVII